MDDRTRRRVRTTGPARPLAQPRFWLAWVLGLGFSASCQLIFPLDDITEGSDQTGDRGTGRDPESVEGPPGNASAGQAGMAGSAVMTPSGQGYDDCTPECDGFTCSNDGCGGYCACPAGTACDPDQRTCETATCYEGVSAPCPVALEPSFVDALETMHHHYEPIVIDDACSSGFAVHLHCDACGELPNGYLPVCWVRCVCDEEVDTIDRSTEH